MQHLSPLLKKENSTLAQILRFSLYGLHTSLTKALAEINDDPGASDCSELIKELNYLLEENSESEGKEELISPSDTQSSEQDVSEQIIQPEPSQPVPEPESSSVSTTDELLLEPLRKDFLSDQDLLSYLAYLEPVELKSTNDSDLWNEVQRLLLRVPEKLAKEKREHFLDIAKGAGAKPDYEQLMSNIPFSSSKILYPGLSDKVQASGLQLSAEVLSGEVKREGDLYFLAGVVSTYLELINIDPSLHHVLESVYSFGIKSFHSEPEQQDKYITALIDRFQRAQKAEGNPDPTLTLQTRLDLDEAIHSLVYLPPADRYSWWGKLQQQARRTLRSVADQARNAGYNVQIRYLWGRYSEVCDHSKNDLELDRGGSPGDVLACLRVYAKINEEVFPGRVLYRSSE
ncbi:MAG: hypothetical protein F6K58_20670 [Symploca sp. SIO2E9]|nr:hypothetical protein [Symploca sp. SIO2E9]